MEEEDGFGVRAGWIFEVEEVAIWSEATDDGGTGRGVEGMALGGVDPV